MPHISEDDYKLTPSGRLGGMVSVSTHKHLASFHTTEAALEFVRQDMEASQYWPCVWWISDHGNAWMIDDEGNEITEFCEDDEE